MLLPAIFHFTAEALHDVKLAEHEQSVSLWTSGILVTVYVLGLVFTLKTHAHIFSPKPKPHPEEQEAGRGGPTAGPRPSTGAAHRWTLRRSVILLLVASAGVGIVAELLVGSAESLAESLTWNPIFVGVILLAIIGNAAEHSSAIVLARRGDMDTAMTIAFQSSIQIALFATPALVFASLILAAGGGSAARPLDLVFTPMEVVAVMLTVGAVVVLCQNGESNWFEGVLLLSLYAIMAIAFFFIPAARGA